jgi:cyclopropane fatty-acyl-phospholipid synthase-like methyltransferase
MGLTNEQVIAVKADAAALPFEKEFFDAVISTDSYNYFGRDPDYLDRRLLPFVKHGAYIYIAIPGMKRDCHENLSQELLLSWTPEQLAFMHDTAYWTGIAEGSREAEIVSIHEMESFDEVWNDWLEQDNEYAVNDRKAMNAGGGKYLNFIAIVLRRK